MAITQSARSLAAIGMQSRRMIGLALILVGPAAACGSDDSGDDKGGGGGSGNVSGGGTGGAAAGSGGATAGAAGAATGGLGAAAGSGGVANYDIYYVAPLSTSCNPASPGSGTEADPWTNLYYALTQGGLKCGDHLQLRAGVYYNDANGFDNTKTEQDRFDACTANEANINAHTVMPLLRSYVGGPACAGNPVVVENYPGESVELTGTPRQLVEAKAKNNWIQCTNHPEVWYMPLNVGSSDVQLWMDGDAAANDAGTMIFMHDTIGAWPGGGACPNLPDGRAANDSGPDEVAINPPGNIDPNDHEWRAGMEGGGDGSSHVIHIATDNVTVRRHPGGGSFSVTAGRYGLVMDDEAWGSTQSGTFSSFIVADGLQMMACGSADYGFCFRMWQANDSEFINGSVHDTVAEGGGPYCGDTAQKGGSNCYRNAVRNTDVYDTGLGWGTSGTADGTSNLGHGIVSRNCTDCEFTGNRVRRVYRSGISLAAVHQGPCAAEPGGCSHDNALVEGNEIWDWGFYCAGGSPPNCTQTCNFGSSAAVWIASSQNPTSHADGIVVRNNMIRGGCSANPGVGAPGFFPSEKQGSIKNWVLAFNSFYNLRGVGAYLRENKASASTGTMIGNTFHQVALANGNQCGGSDCAVYMEAASQVGTHSHNNYWSANSDDTVVALAGTAAHTRANVGSWESTAIQVAPGHTSTKDLHLSSTSALIDKVDCALAPAQDFDGKARPKAGVMCDVGADER